MVNCWVYKCESAGFKLQPLTMNIFGIPTEVIVCELHRSEIADENPEWILIRDHENNTQDLYVGRSLRELQQYLVTEAPTTASVHAQGGTYQYSDGTSGIHIPIPVRMRGKEQSEELALVFTPESLVAFADRMNHFADRHRHLAAPDVVE